MVQVHLQVFKIFLDKFIYILYNKGVDKVFRVTFRVLAESEDYFDMVVTKKEYDTIDKFLSILNSESGQVSISVYNVQIV